MLFVVAKRESLVSVSRAPPGEFIYNLSTFHEIDDDFKIPL
jgi:hypothetical protein